MLHPRPLHIGDRVAVVSPAGPVQEQHLEFGISTLQSWGLDVVVDERVYRRDTPGYLAGEDQHRLDALQSALDDEDIAAIFCSRGGYGTMRLLPQLDLESLRASPRLVVGFSDITALHLHLAGVAGIPTLHAPVVKSFEQHESYLEDLRRAVFGERTEDDLTVAADPVMGGHAVGRLIGGNLSLVASTLASRYSPDLDGCILLLEDVGEEDYRLDRLFTTIRLATCADGLAGIILGDFTDCGGTYVDDEDIPDFVRGLARELGEAFDCPIVADYPSGHAERNMAAPMGVETEIHGATGLVRHLTDAVRGVEK